MPPEPIFNPRSDTVFSEEVLITPEIASLLLENNAINRPIADGHVLELADQMKRGLWELNGEAIILSREGIVLDGQHRLWAVIESKKSVTMLITRGIDKDTFHTIDTGRKRSGGDVLAIHSKLSGEPIRYAQQVSAAITICLEYQRDTLKKKGRGDAKVSRADILHFYESNPGIELWVVRSKVKKDWATAYSASVAAVCYLTSKHYEMKAMDFMHGFITGENLGGRSPILALRTRLGVEKRMFKWERLALMIYAMRAFVENRELTILKPPKGEIPLIPGTEPKGKKAKPEVVNVNPEDEDTPKKPVKTSSKSGLKSLKEVFKGAGYDISDEVPAKKIVSKKLKTR